MEVRKDALNEKMLRDAGIDAIVKDYMPIINHRFKEYSERIEQLEEELRIERIRNEEQLKIIETTVGQLIKGTVHMVNVEALPKGVS